MGQRSLFFGSQPRIHAQLRRRCTAHAEAMRPNYPLQQTGAVGIRLYARIRYCADRVLDANMRKPPAAERER
jgi:hypothetical protein